MKVMRSFRYLLSAAAGLGLLAASAVSYAIPLNIGDANYLGRIVDGIPSNAANEIVYINNLITLGAGAAATPCGTETCDRLNSTLVGPFPDAELAGAARDDTGGTTVDATDFQYILGKYDAAQAGSLVWFFASGAPGDVTLPSTLNGLGLSHISLYNPGGGGQEVPEPGTLLMLGAGLLGLGLLRVRAGRWSR
jgi:hypothetical protein